MRHSTARTLSIISMVVVILLGLILIPSENELAMMILFVIYIPIAIVLNYFQRCPHCGAWPRKGSLFDEYCPRCGGRLVKRTGLSKNTGKQYTYYCCEFHNSKDERRKCDFATFDVPVKDSCPQCGRTMFKKSGRGARKPFCIHEDCSNFTPEEKRGGYVQKAAAESADETAEKKSAAQKTATKKTAEKKTTKTAAKKTTTRKKKEEE